MQEEKLDIFKYDLTKGRARLEELKKIEAKQQGTKKYRISNGFVYTSCPERWSEFIKE